MIKTFNFFYYFRFCRVVDPPAAFEEHEMDQDEFPILGSNVYGIPKPGDAVIINPQPGCFGRGPQALKSKSGYFGLDTASLVTYGRYYKCFVKFFSTVPLS